MPVSSWSVPLKPFIPAVAPSPGKGADLLGGLGIPGCFLCVGSCLGPVEEENSPLRDRKARWWLLGLLWGLRPMLRAAAADSVCRRLHEAFTHDGLFRRPVFVGYFLFNSGNVSFFVVTADFENNETGFLNELGFTEEGV